MEATHEIMQGLQDSITVDLPPSFRGRTLEVLVMPLDDASRQILCDMVKMELYFGAYRSARREQNPALLDSLFATFTSLPFDSAAARSCGEFRAVLAGIGKPIGPYDIQIASIALGQGPHIGHPQYW